MIKPKNQQVLIKPFPPDDLSSGGIVVPMSYRARNNKSLVVAVGLGTDSKPMRFSPGMVVHNIKDCGELFIIDDQDYYLINQDWILATEN